MGQRSDPPDEVVARDLPELLHVLEEIKTKVPAVTQHVLSISEHVQRSECSTESGISLLEVKVHLILSSLVNLTQLMLMKTDGHSIHHSPPVHRLVEIRTVLEKIRPLDQKLHYQIDKLIRIATTGLAGPADDPLRFRANPTHMVSKQKEEVQKEHEHLNLIKHQQLELLDMIGQGGYGAVFRGKWKDRKGEVVAVKKCTLTRAKRDFDILREMQILSSVPEHPHVISFYGLSMNFPDVLIVTEFAEKGSLFNYLHKEKQVPTVDQSLAWALEVAQGIEHIHNHDIIHRDLKSANVLLSSAMTAKVCDFGTARYLSHTTVQTKASDTFRWMAPEVMEAVEANINKKCDSFSYGMVVYELFVHQVPYYDTPGDGVVCMKVLQGELPPIPPTIPQYLHSLLIACWERDPHKRPTFHDIVQGLQNESC